VVFLGHVISVEGIIVDPKKVKVVLKREHSTNVTKMHNFLRLDIIEDSFKDSQP